MGLCVGKGPAVAARTQTPVESSYPSSSSPLPRTPLPKSPLPSRSPIAHRNQLSKPLQSPVFLHASETQKSPTRLAFPLPPPPPEFTLPSSAVVREPEPGHSTLQAYTFQQLEKATSGFSSSYLLGEGGYGTVYKGFLELANHGAPGVLQPVAVKRLLNGSFQGKKEWLHEIGVLGKLVHPNLVHLMGYCCEANEKLLVFEFLPMGSLDYHLFQGPLQMPPIGWRSRVRIAVDAASGLAHLHHKNVIHRDFKAPNILLDEHYSAKLTDFGLAKEADGDRSYISTVVKGTLGYLDPCYAATGRLTKRSDVYAYGVLLLELVTGKRAMGHLPSGKLEPLVAWASPMLGRKILVEELVDPRLQEQFPRKVSFLLLRIASKCVEEDDRLRPSMEEVVANLSQLGPMVEGLSHSR